MATTEDTKDQMTIQQILRRDDDIKARALSEAIDVHRNNHVNGRKVDDATVVKTAQKFEDFLRGKTEQQ